MNGLSFPQDWAAVLAHEIKNPVALALANIELIRLEDTQGRLTRYCDRIERALEQIGSLAQAMLPEYSLTGNLSAGGQAIDLDGMLVEITQEYNTAWPDITFKYERPGHALTVAGGTPLRMIFANIYKNAAEAGCKQVEASTETGGAFVRVVVRDDGTGLDVNAQASSGGYTSKPNGNGMGLLICGAIAARYGGDFHIENTERGGCEATVTLPIAL